MILSTSSFCLRLLLQSLYTVFYPLKRILNAILFIWLVVFTVILVYPLLILVFTPILLYRKLVAIFVQKWDSKCGVMLSGLDAVMASKDPYNKAFVVLSPYFTFNDKLERSHIVAVLNEQIIQPNLFPNLKQRIVRKFGYYFWYPVNNFNVEHHVSYLNPKCPEEPVPRTALRRVGVEKIGQLPFDPSKSPWELILVPNLIDENNPSVKSAIFVRVNHCLMDGYALASFTQKAAVKPWKIDVANALNSKQSGDESGTNGMMAIIKQLVILFQVLVTGPYHFLYGTWYLKDNSAFLKKALRPPASKEDLGWAVKETEPRKIDGARLKKLRKPLNVTVSSLLLTMVSEGVIRFIKRRCNDGFCEKLPKSICLHMSFPLPGHPGKMKNHWTAVRMAIPVNKDGDPTKTLRNVHEHYQNFKTSVVPLVNFVASQLMGALPIFMLPDFEKLVIHTIALTNFPGPAGKLDMFGYEWEGACLSGGPPDGSVFVVTCESFHGKFAIDVGGVKSVLRSQEDLNELEDHVYDVLNELESTVLSQLSSEDAENHADAVNRNQRY